ncbi:hypothetical protein HZA39_02220 [Candidatus Peregrinibacteria bacterium]|nr:hypothetical protein [Candidatus Peregrinibacteria bacterium]
MYTPKKIQFLLYITKTTLHFLSFCQIAKVRYEDFFNRLKEFTTEEDFQIIQADTGLDLPVVFADSLIESAAGEIDILCLQISKYGFSIPVNYLEKRHSQLYLDLQSPPIMFNFNQFTNTAIFEITNIDGLKPKLDVKLDKNQNLVVMFMAYKKGDKLKIIPIIVDSNEVCNIQRKPSGMSSEHQVMANKASAEIANSLLVEKIVLRNYLNIEEKDFSYNDVKKVFNSIKLTPEMVGMNEELYPKYSQETDPLNQRKFLLICWLKEQMRVD